MQRLPDGYARTGSGGGRRARGDREERISEQANDARPRRSYREASLLGFLLSSAHGFRVLGPDGAPLGILDSMRYERHADFPEEIVVRRGRFVWKRYRRIPFDSIRSVDTQQRTVRLDRLSPDPAGGG